MTLILWLAIGVSVALIAGGIEFLRTHPLGRNFRMPGQIEGWARPARPWDDNGW